jgi:hypothetical protein
MENPLAARNLAATAVTVGTGYRALQNGATPLQSVTIGLTWRWWYRNLTLSFGLLALAGIVSLAHPAYWWFGVSQLAINLAVFGITYVILVDFSGFKQRAWYRLWSPVHHVLFPNVSRIWWYMLIFLPLWLMVWWRFYSYVEPPHVDPAILQRLEEMKRQAAGS